MPLVFSFFFEGSAFFAQHSPRRSVALRSEEEETYEFPVNTEILEINNSSIIPLLDAAHKRYGNRYATVLNVARKAEQRAEIQIMSQQYDDSKPVVKQLEAEYDFYWAEQKKLHPDDPDDANFINDPLDPRTRG